MSFLNSYRVVHLIRGVEPFRTDALQATAIKAAIFMDMLVESIVQRLETDINMCVALASYLDTLSTIVDNVEIHISRSSYENTEASRNCSSNFLWRIFPSKSRVDDEHSLGQQRMYLDSLRRPSTSLLGLLFSKSPIRSDIDRGFIQYGLDQKPIYLNSIRPDTQKVTESLRHRAQVFGAARDDCQRFRERLRAEELAAN